MPQDVTISWLGGGIALIAAVLLVAYIVPLPGQALASIEMPQLFDSTRDTSASEFGWGAEGAERSDPDAATTAGDQSSSGKEIHSGTIKSGGAAGDVGDGNRTDGPAGKQTGGKQQAAGTDGQDKSESETAKNRQQGEDKEQSQGQQQGQKPHAESNAAENPTADQQTPPDQSPNNRGDAGKEQFDPKRRQSSRNITDMISTAASGFGSLLKFLIMIVLAAVVARFAWLNWQRLIGWLRSLFNADQEEQIAPLQEFLIEPAAPPRPFSSYQNPIGSEADYRRIVVITFQAFEAWSREQGAPRGKDETPTEFVRRAASSIPNVGLPVSAVVDAYNRVVYGREQATRQDVQAASAVWQLMR